MEKVKEVDVIKVEPKIEVVAPIDHEAHEKKRAKDIHRKRVTDFITKSQKHL